MKPNIELPNRMCTLCNEKDIHDEYHIVLNVFISNSEDKMY